MQPNMSSTLGVTPYELELICQAYKKQQASLSMSQQSLPLERKAVGSPVANRQRAASCRSPTSTDSSPTSPGKFNPSLMFNDQMSFPPTTNFTTAMPSQTPLSAHRKLDRSFSEPVDRQSKGSNINPSRYKTEMCRPFEESGHCKYGDKCQFAHGAHELRNLARHPKYKTDLCRTFHTIGFCPYGPRCHFIHNEDEHKLSLIIHQKHQQAVNQAAQQVVQAAQYQQLQLSSSTSRHPAPIGRPKLNMPPPGFGRDILGSTADSPTDSSDSLSSESPQSMSPTSSVLSDHDVFSPSSMSSCLGSTALTPPPFNFPGSSSSSHQHHHHAADLSAAMLSMHTSPTPIMTPLNVNTDPLASLAAGIHAVQQQQLAQQLQQQQATRDITNSTTSRDLFYTPPSPPDSVNGDSEVENLLKGRLPFFSGLGSED